MIRARSAARMVDGVGRQRRRRHDRGRLRGHRGRDGRRIRIARRCGRIRDWLAAPIADAKADRERDGNGDEYGESRHGLSVGEQRVVECSDDASERGAVVASRVIAVALSRKRESDVARDARLLESNVHIFPVAHVRSRRPSFVPNQRGAGRVRELPDRAAQAESERGAAEVDAPRQTRAVSIGDADRRRGPGHRRRRCRLARRQTRAAARCASRPRSACPPSNRRRRPTGKAQTQLATELREAAGESHAARGAARGIAGAAGGAGGALPRSRAVARRNRDLRDRAGAAGREPATAARGQRVVGAHRAAARRRQAAAPRPPAVRSAAPRAVRATWIGSRPCRTSTSSGMSLKLDQAIAAVDTLPLAMDERVPPPPPDKTAPPADESAMATGAARDLGRREAADPHRSRRPPGGAARARRAAVFSAREPEAAPAHRADRAARAKRRELPVPISRRSRRGSSSISTRARSRCRRCRRRSSSSPRRRCPARRPT